MSDTQFAAYDAKCKTAADRRAEILPHNKGVLFDALIAAGIVLVTADFDGSGDSGQFEAPAAFDALNAEMSVPKGDITIKVVDFDSGAISEETTTVRNFVETLAYDFIEDQHSGWEDGEGAYGVFKFDAVNRTITLEYNERYTETHYHEHEF